MTGYDKIKKVEFQIKIESKITAKFFGKKDKSFTVIEVLVAIAIIGLLSSIILISLNSARAKGKDARRQADLKQINLAMEMCYGDSACSGLNSYPVITGGTNNLTQIDSDGTPLYLMVPKDPTDTSPYQYIWTANASPYQYYCLYSKLEAQVNTYTCASNKGIKTKTTPFAACAPNTVPCNLDCCGFDVTQ